MKKNKIFIYDIGVLLPVRIIKKTVEEILDGEKKSGMTINIILKDGKFISELNMKYRHKKGDTDVITFVNDEPAGGDIYISKCRAKSDAKELGITIKEEILRLVVHGCLHICGYTHKGKKDRMIMKSAEEKYLKSQEYGTLII